jgi:hypothetical protein
MEHRSGWRVSGPVTYTPSFQMLFASQPLSHGSRYQIWVLGLILFAMVEIEKLAIRRLGDKFVR